jgi:hypothetical protein
MHHQQRGCDGAQAQPLAHDREPIVVQQLFNNVLLEREQAEIISVACFWQHTCSRRSLKRLHCGSCTVPAEHTTRQAYHIEMSNNLA